ncbi:hypothetical protein DMB66_27245 [Actinoplanes sp. ATCC 53533]|uniref:hypothetical protein n=1 Tax=Actinoplanes sp. ATCC 53533 TaxID=1288362 RepID=UPI000F7BB11F|nr:hypothetical protein [Actinoplanes sp. ATCC 53533]RSM59590.1 hypothetical protein DMB66_27245 [Actinoplanes sp. ATCC 53533]
MSLSVVLFRNRRLAAGLLAGVTVATLAACGSKDDSSGASTTPANGSTESTGRNGGPGGGGGAMAAYFQCLQQNGVTMGGPGGGTPPSGAPGGTMPSGAPGGGDGGPGGNGTPPSGAPGGGNGGPGGGPGGARTITKPDGVTDEVWAKAQSACASLAPSAAPAATASS